MTKRKRVHKHDGDKPVTDVEKSTSNETTPTCTTQTNLDREAIITPRWFATADLTSTPESTKTTLKEVEDGDAANGDASTPTQSRATS